MKQKDKFRYAEKCLYNYKPNLACLEVLRGDLQIKRSGSDVHAQNYQSTFGFSGEPSSPVYSHVVSIETLEEKIRHIERWTNPITKLIADLNNPYTLAGSKNIDLLHLLNFMYFGENTPKEVMNELKISNRTFTRRRKELVNITIDYLGL